MYSKDEPIFAPFDHDSVINACYKNLENMASWWPPKFLHVSRTCIIENVQFSPSARLVI